MNRATPSMRVFAARLIAFEAAGSRSPEAGVSAAFAVPDRMRAPIATLMGNGGHRALLQRTLALAAAEVSWLRETWVGVGGNLEAPDSASAAASGDTITPDEVHEGGVVLVAQLIGLLVAFIGERLTLQLVRDVWPKLPAKDLIF